MVTDLGNEAAQPASACKGQSRGKKYKVNFLCLRACLNESRQITYTPCVSDNGKHFQNESVECLAPLICLPVGTWDILEISMIS